MFDFEKLGETYWLKLATPNDQNLHLAIWTYVPGCQSASNANNNGAENSGPKSFNEEPRYKECGETEHCGIYHKKENPERNDRQGKRKKYNNRPNNRIYKPKNQSCKQQRQHAINLDSRNEGGCEPQSRGCYE